MALKIPAQPNYFKVDTSSDRNVQWHDGSMVYVEDITTFYVLDDGSWIEISTGGTSSMVYPGAGIALSNGTGWLTSVTNNSADWNTAYGWGNHASAGYLTAASALDASKLSGTIGAAVLQVEWDTAYTHSQDNTQAHSDYLINNGNDTTSGTITAGGFTTTGNISGIIDGGSA